MIAAMSDNCVRHNYERVHSFAMRVKDLKEREVVMNGENSAVVLRSPYFLQSVLKAFERRCQERMDDS